LPDIARHFHNITTTLPDIAGHCHNIAGHCLAHLDFAGVLGWV